MSPRHVIRRLGAGDEAALAALLARHAESSMFLRGNLQAVGLGYSGRPLEGVYVGRIVDDCLVGVAAHYWNGVIVLQAPDDAGTLASAAVAESGRAVHGLIGPRAQVTAGRAALGAESRPTTLDSTEVLFRLGLDELRVPDPLAGGAWVCRRSRSSDLALLIEWRADYAAEAFGEPATPANRAKQASVVERGHTAGDLFVLEVDNRPASSCQFNAAAGDTVQIGGVWTPPALRRRGYAQAVVAGALLAVRATGTRTAILFTNEDNLAARRAYEKLGFAPIGDYGLVMFSDI